jgi:hypothetical protein
MAAADEIRNIQELTTGDFIDFEFLHDGVWKRAQVAGTATRIMRVDSQTDREVFDANLEQIVSAARRLANSAPPGEKIKINSYDL